MRSTNNPRGAAQNESITIVPVSSRWPMARSAAASSSRSNPPPTTVAGRAPKIQAAFSFSVVPGAWGASGADIPVSGQRHGGRISVFRGRPVEARVPRIPRNSGHRRDSPCHRRCRRWSPPRVAARPCRVRSPALPPSPPHRATLPRAAGASATRPPASRQSTRMVFLCRAFMRRHRGIDRGLMAETPDSRLGARLRIRTA